MARHQLQLVVHFQGTRRVLDNAMLIATHGFTGIKRLFMGSVTERVVRSANCPVFTVKSLAGFLIQIPVFIAAFDMLAENVALNQVSFFWMADLARPDAFAPKWMFSVNITPVVPNVIAQWLGLM